MSEKTKSKAKVQNNNKSKVKTRKIEDIPVKDQQILLRVTAQEKLLIKLAAEKRNESVSKLIMDAVLNAVV